MKTPCKFKREQIRTEHLFCNQEKFRQTCENLIVTKENLEKVNTTFTLMKTLTDSS